MKKYNILETPYEYKYVVIGNDYVHPISYISKLESCFTELNYKGFILIDGLMSNGFSKNRLSEVYFNGMNFEKKKLNLVNSLTNDMDLELYSYFENNPSVVDKSNRIPDAQKYLLKKGLLKN